MHSAWINLAVHLHSSTIYTCPACHFSVLSIWETGAHLDPPLSAAGSQRLEAPDTTHKVLTASYAASPNQDVLYGHVLLVAVDTAVHGAAGLRHRGRMRPGQETESHPVARPGHCLTSPGTMAGADARVQHARRALPPADIF